MFAASPVQGNDAETEPDSKISGLLWGVPFPTIVLSCWAEWVLVSSLLYVLILVIYQLELLSQQQVPRVDQSIHQNATRNTSGREWSKPWFSQ